MKFWTFANLKPDVNGNVRKIQKVKKVQNFIDIRNLNFFSNPVFGTKYILKFLILDIQSIIKTEKSRFFTEICNELFLTISEFQVFFIIWLKFSLE